jgi:poly(A) polymerase
VEFSVIEIYSGEELGIDIAHIDHHALHILERLEAEGFKAYLVGGSVRDLISQRTPKDFDIATSASPEEIKALFRRTLLIGRRFRLAHVRFGNKVFEVSTFRSGSNEDDDLIIRDNEWGTPEEDALRRDFTINGLFYDLAENSVIDYVGGCADLKKGVLRTIGEPSIRFKQDPVRMIRLLKFYARFDFKIDSHTLDAMQEYRGEINKSAPARVMEEMLRMLESGCSKKFFHSTRDHEILDHIFPWLDLDRYKEISTYLELADEHDLYLSRPVLFACLIFPILQKKIKSRGKGKINNLRDIEVVISDFIKDMVDDSLPLIPRRMREDLSYLLNMQYRLVPEKHIRVRRSSKVIQRHEFRYVLQFLQLRAKLDKDLIPIHQHWLEEWHENYSRHQKPRRRTKTWKQNTR